MMALRMKSNTRVMNILYLASEAMKYSTSQRPDPQSNGRIFVVESERSISTENGHGVMTSDPAVISNTPASSVATEYRQRRAVK